MSGLPLVVWVAGSGMAVGRADRKGREARRRLKAVRRSGDHPMWWGLSSREWRVVAVVVQEVLVLRRPAGWGVTVVRRVLGRMVVCRRGWQQQVGDRGHEVGMRAHASATRC